MLFDPAIDVSQLSEFELDQLVQSLPSYGTHNDDNDTFQLSLDKIQTALPFGLLQQQGLWSKMSEMFENNG